MKPYYPFIEYDVFAYWEINLYCNYDCSYCYFHLCRKKYDPKYSGHSVEKLRRAFDNITGTWLIHMSGGEPFFQPDLVELCRRLTKRHYVSINSNLSTPAVYDFADEVDPRRVPRILASLHVDQRRNLEDFIDKIRYLRDRGFKVYVSQVMYPPILNRFEKCFQYLKRRGIIIKPQVFRGIYRMKRYPRGYTEEERCLFTRYYNESREDSDDEEGPVSIEDQILEGDFSFKGIRCNAGRNYVFLRFNGDLMRCHGESRRLGNIFEGQMDLFEKPRLCRAQTCPCPHFGLRHAEGIPSLMGFNFGTVLSMSYRTYLFLTWAIRRHL